MESTTFDPAAPGATPETAPSNQVMLPIAFHGTGKEYFRIWIVNLLLIIITLTLYYPWARVRKLVYFAQNTTVGGDPLSFHGKARQMFIGYFIALIGAIAYVVSQETLPWLALILLLAYLLMWPWLFRMAHRFRMGKTQWRGLPFGFSGTNQSAYLTFLVPLIVYGLIVGLGFFVQAFLIDLSEDGLPESTSAATVGTALSLMTVVGVLAAPYFFYLIKRYQHNNFSYASVKTQFSAGAGAFYMIAIKTVLLSIAVYLGLMVLLVAAVVVIGLAMGLTLENFKDTDWAQAGFAATIVAGVVGAYLLFYLLFSAISAYFQTAIFNVSWSNTTAEKTRFLPSLQFSKYWRLKIKNTILIVLTLGLYIPFAQIALARIKLHNLKVETSLDMNQIIADVQSGKVSAAADAAADILDVDIGI